MPKCIFILERCLLLLVFWEDASVASEISSASERCGVSFSYPSPPIFSSFHALIYLLLHSLPFSFPQCDGEGERAGAAVRAPGLLFLDALHLGYQIKYKVYA